MTFGDYGNLGEPLLGVPGQYDMEDQLPIQITVMWGTGGDKIVELSLAPDTTMDELWDKVKALPSCPQYQASSISNANGLCCISVTIKGEVYPISLLADSTSIEDLQDRLNENRAGTACRSTDNDKDSR